MGIAEGDRAGAGRWTALDALRGLAVFLMLPINTALDFERIPDWFKHAPGQGIYLADFVMPAFLFSLGLSSSLSFRRRLAEKGLARTAGHALFRYGLIFLFGTIGFFLVWKRENWEILQMLGLTGLATFPFLFLKPVWRAAAALALLAAVEALRPSVFGPAFGAWYRSGIGGPLGTIPLAAIPIAASALGEAISGLSWKGRAAGAALAGVLALGAGLALSRLSAPDKHLLTPSYLLVALGAAALALACLEALVRAAGGADIPLLGALGRNPLLAYMAGGILTLAARAILPPGAEEGLAWAASLATLAIMVPACALLDRRGLRLRL
jgi:predicted acyltransferase